MVIYGVMSLGLMFEKRKYAFWVELLRLIIFSGAIFALFSAAGVWIPGLVLAVAYGLASLIALFFLADKPQPAHAL